jgi:3-phenylpropionate/trans-cinnamate dioxygenase ferredoxin reductase subunit
MQPRTVLILGAGLAGSRCAETLRARGFDGRILLVGEEPWAAYERPALSKGFLAGTRTPESLRLRPASFLAERGIVLLTGRRAVEVGLRSRRALLDDGAELDWDALVLATGGRARELGPSPAGVHTLRSLADAERLRRDLRASGRLVIVGPGLVGGEVASTATSLGVGVTVIGPGRPLERLVGAEIAELLARRYEAHGVELVLGQEASGFRTGAGKQLVAAVLTNGTHVPCDAALVAVGGRPESALLQGLVGPDGGVQTDESGRTCLPDVYACGDVASPWRGWLGRHLRVEHWTEAATRGAAVARAILGEQAEQETDVPYFWSDQFGLRLQLVGHVPHPFRLELEGDEESFAARYRTPDDVTSAVLLANRPADVASARRELAGSLPLAA